jgi:hypothetical protein
MYIYIYITLLVKIFNEALGIKIKGKKEKTCQFVLELLELSNREIKE